MKAIKLLVLGMILAFAGSAQSQISINLNIGTRPDWGPRGYEHARYYYLPDVEAYYDINTTMFIYLSGNQWIHRNYLPARYKNYDLHKGRKVVMTNYHGDKPYFNHKAYKVKYGHANQKAQQRKVVSRKVENGNKKAVVNRNNQNSGKNNQKKNQGKKGK